MSEIGSLELHFNSRDARVGKIGTLCGAVMACGWRAVSAEWAPAWRKLRGEKV